MDEDQLLGVSYFEWLYDQVFIVRDQNSPVSYLGACSIMNNMRFRALVPHDENRIADCAEFRNRFMNEFAPDPLEAVNILTPDASIFEVLVGLAFRASFMIGIRPEEFFYKLLSNLGLQVFSDSYYTPQAGRRIKRILERFNNRQYGASGLGGLFPLAHPDADQRQIELWYQMGAWMTENQMY